MASIARGSRPAAAVLVLCLAGCVRGASYPAYDPEQNAPVLHGASLAPDDLAARGAVAPGCLFGWVEPRLPSRLADAPAAAAHLAGVARARLFDGPAPTDEARTTRYAALVRAGGGRPVLLADAGTPSPQVIAALPAAVSGCLAGLSSSSAVPAAATGAAPGTSRP